MPRKSLIAAAVAVLAVPLTFVPTAAADKPSKEPVPNEDATGQFCADFPVLVHATTNREFAYVFSSGATLITGTLKVEVTNLETGKTIALNVSGPGRISADGTTLTAVGTWIFFGEASTFGPGSPPELSINSGRVVISLADTSFVSRIGKSVDLCPLLAG